MQVQVKRRETERQQEMRVSSYAYLAEREQEEAWQDLDAHAPSSALAEGVWSALHSASESEVPMGMDREAYLGVLLPGILRCLGDTSPLPAAELGTQQAVLIAKVEVLLSCCRLPDQGDAMNVRGPTLCMLQQAVSIVMYRPPVWNRAQCQVLQ